MADTGAPWNIPYVEPSDLVRDYPAADEAQAFAVAAGLSAAGGLVAVRYVEKTNVQSTSVGAGGNVAVSGLSIEHAVAEVGNRLLITAWVGVAGNSQGGGNTGLFVTQDGTPLTVGDAAGSRTRLSAGGRTAGAQATATQISMPNITVAVTPTAGTKTYEVRAVNVQTATQTVFIGRSSNDDDSAGRSRGSAALLIMEVKV